jgi:hypothetical protein
MHLQWVNELTWLNCIQSFIPNEYEHALFINIIVFDPWHAQ